MGSANRLKLDLFGANCSSGRAVTTVPERWSGNGTLSCPMRPRLGNLPGGLSASPFHRRPASSPTLLLGRQGGEYRSEVG